MPPASLRIRPARTISLWLTSSASAGASLSVARKYREELGLLPSHVKIVGRTRNWLRYEVPARWLKRDWRGNYRGQKQIWFLLRLVGRDCDVHLRASEKPEFDAWRWNDYWVPLDSVIDFKREVYQHALTELARYLFRGQGRKPLPAEIASR